MYFKETIFKVKYFYKNERKKTLRTRFGRTCLLNGNIKCDMQLNNPQKYNILRNEVAKLWHTY